MKIEAIHNVGPVNPDLQDEDAMNKCLFFSEGDLDRFVFAAVCPLVGASVGLKIDLEALPIAPGTIPIEFQGQVIRVEQPQVEKGSRGFAVCV